MKPMTKQNKLNIPGPADLEKLEAILSKGGVVSQCAVEGYSRDESTRIQGVPTAVVRPKSQEEVAATLKWASAGLFPIIPRGAGTGVAGGAVAVGGGVVLSLERLNKILEIDEENLTITCEPGVVTGKIHNEVESRGFFYPPDPSSLDSCSIGGNIAVGAGGPRAVKYGCTKDYVLGLRVALPCGEIISLGGKIVKNATGYHLLDLMIGSEGTFGIVTEATLRLLPLPSRRAGMLIPFPSIQTAAQTVASLIKAKIIPAIAEFMDDTAIAAARNYLGRDLPGGSTAGAYVFIELDGEDEGSLDEEMLKISEISMDFGALDILAAHDATQRARLWESRRCLAEALKARSGEIGKADVVVPRSKVPQLVEAAKEAGAAHGLTATCFGHAGDGNVHVNILKEGLDTLSWSEKLPKVMELIMEATRFLGGQPSGEHGIGILKKQELLKFCGPRSVEIMRSIKNSFDPNGILNPGKVI